MDLHLRDQAPTDAERAAITAVVGEVDDADQRVTRRRGGPEHRRLLLPVFARLQADVGWISPAALDEVCRRLDVPPAEAYGVATFYALLRTEPTPPRVAHVCDDIACGSAGGSLRAALEDLMPASGSSAADHDRRVAIEAAGCLGHCDRPAAVYVQRAGAGDGVLVGADPSMARAALDGDDPLPAPEPGRVVAIGEPRLTRRLGRVEPTDIRAFRGAGGFEALRVALDVGPTAIIDAVTSSGLRGRGGAAFPTGAKWAAVAAAAGPRELICNADESEPGTFKDRVLMEGDPFALVEAMTIAGVATGCARGHLYLRGEYPVAAARMAAAIDQARADGVLGPDVLGSGQAFDIEIHRGQGAYVCGEETALIASIEGRRGEPANKPPYPTTHGLFGHPTVVNNVETLLNVPHVLLDGPQAFASVGTAASAGTRLFCVSGDVSAAGVVEAPMGATLGEVIDACGGVTAPLQAVLLGGAAGAFVPPDLLDLPLTFEDARHHGVSLGSGVVMPFTVGTDFGVVLRRVAAFFRDESCGQCVPCRVGTVRQEESLARYLDAGRDPAELRLLADLDAVMTDASICGLGQTAASALRSAIDLELL